MRSMYPADQSQACRFSVSDGSITAGYATSASRLPRLLAAYRKYGSAEDRWPNLENQDCNSGALDATTKNGSPIITSSRTTIPKNGYSDPCGARVRIGLTGACVKRTITAIATRGTARTNRCTRDCRSRPSRLGAVWAYVYPASNSAWKKTMQVLQTAGVPPKRGRTILPTIGCTRNKRNALTKRVAAKNRATSGFSWERCVAIGYAEEECVSIAVAAVADDRPARC